MSCITICTTLFVKTDKPINLMDQKRLRLVVRLPVLAFVFPPRWPNCSLVDALWYPVAWYHDRCSVCSKSASGLSLSAERRSWCCVCWAPTATLSL